MKGYEELLCWAEGFGPVGRGCELWFLPSYSPDRVMAQCKTGHDPKGSKLKCWPVLMADQPFERWRDW